MEHPVSNVVIEASSDRGIQRILINVQPSERNLRVPLLRQIIAVVGQLDLAVRGFPGIGTDNGVGKERCR